MAEIKYFLAVNPNYPECKNCHILNVFKNAAGSHNIIFKTSTENTDLTQGTLIINCEKKLPNTMYFSTKIRFPKIDQNIEDKNVFKRSKVNISHICPALNHKEERSKETENLSIQDPTIMSKIFTKRV